MAQIAAAVAANVEHERVYVCCRRLNGRERDVGVRQRETCVSQISLEHLSLFDVYTAHNIVRKISLFRHV